MADESTMEDVIQPHPEDCCDECGRPNIVWWAASDRWNHAMGRKPGEAPNPILCPVCFVRRWERATGLRATWRVEPDDRTIRAALECEGGDHV